MSPWAVWRKPDGPWSSYAFLEVGCSRDFISELSVKEGRTHKINHGGSSISVEVSEVSSEGATIDFYFGGQIGSLLKLEKGLDKQPFFLA